MSVHPDRKAWRVRYRDASGRQRSRTFARKGDATDVRPRNGAAPASSARRSRPSLTARR